ncbi:MAG: tRNA (adenosine(37)-N6)-threonylcarbamoyltransferase complex dimerization subunit type 1 TsaB [Myxococcota bacterium]
MGVLGIDTAGPVVGAAWVSPNGVQTWSQRVTRKADRVLLPAIAELLKAADAEAAGGIDLIAVSVGPGAFTGLRVGVSAALGVAFARALPVVAVSSLAARAMMARDGRTFAVLDARKGKVYAGVYNAIPDVPDLIGEEADAVLRDILPDAPFVAVGEGAITFREEIRAAGGLVSPDADRCPADEVARLGARLRGQAMDAGAIALRYLRAPDARVPQDIGRTVGKPQPPSSNLGGERE